MPLAGYQPEYRVIQIGTTNSFQVRGLGLNDVAVLVREHFPDLEALSDLFGNLDEMDAQKMQPLVLSLVSNAPGFVANVIALAAGEGSAEDAERLPFPIQVQALLDIGELTFNDVGGIKKAMELIAALLKKTEVSNKITKTTARIG